MTPKQLELILSALAGAALFSFIILAIGNRNRSQKRRFLPVFIGSALLGMLIAVLNIQSMMAVGWIVGGMLGYAMQRKRA